MGGCKSLFKEFLQQYKTVDGWMDQWMEVKAILRIAGSNQKGTFFDKSGYKNCKW